MEPVSSAHQNRWYDHLAELLSHAPSAVTKLATATPQAIIEYTKQAPAHFADFVQKQKHKRKSFQDDKLTEKVMRSGTMGDKIAAMALVVGDFPMDSFSEFERLVALSHSKSRREANLAQDAVRDLLVESLLPSERRLQTMETSLKQSSHLKLSNEILAMFWFEHLLKQKVLDYYQALQTTAVTKRDELPHHRKLALQRTFDILNEKPEGEIFLLNILCSVSAGKQTNMNFHLLRKLVTSNPHFQLKISQLLEAQAVGPQVNTSAQYDICCYLNQTLFHAGSADSQALANRLMETYFNLFERTSQKAEAEQETKLLSAILTGVNRAFPYASREMCTFKTDELVALVNRTTLFATKTQALMLLFRMSKHEPNESLYDLVYAQVKTKEFVQSRKKQLFLNLLVQILCADKDSQRVSNQLTSLLQAAILDSASLSCAVTFLCSHVMSKRRIEQHHVVQPGWEYDLLRSNYHPTAVAFSTKALQGAFDQVLEYSGDPLLDFSITNFLDKFIYRNPKEKKLEESTFGTKGRAARVGTKAFKQPAVNSEEFHHRYSQRRQVGKLGEESEMVFYNYFNESGKRLAVGAARGRDVDTEEQEDEFADMLAEKLLKQSAGGTSADMDEADDLFERELRKEFKRSEVSDDEDDDMDLDDEELGALGEDDDDQVEGFDDEEEVDFDDEGEEDEEEEEEGLSVFADADDFAGMIEGTEDVDEYEKYLKKPKANNKRPAASFASKKTKQAAPPKKKFRR